MKKIILSIVLLTALFSSNLFSQITLETTFPTGTSKYFKNFSTIGYKFAIVDEPNAVINIYNTNYTLHSSISISAPANHTLSFVGDLTNELYNSDTLIEVVLQYTNDNTFEPLTLIKNSSTNVFSLTNGTINAVYYTGNNEYRMKVNNNTLLQEEIYLLPGTLPCSDACPLGGSTGIKTDNSSSDISGLKVFPNPSTGTFHVQFTEEINKIIVIDVLGKEISYLNVKAAEANINMTDYAPGTYYVEVISKTGLVTVKTLIKQ